MVFQKTWIRPIYLRYFSANIYQVKLIYSLRIITETVSCDYKFENVLHSRFFIHYTVEQIDHCSLYLFLNHSWEFPDVAKERDENW